MYKQGQLKIMSAYVVFFYFSHTVLDRTVRVHYWISSLNADLSCYLLGSLPKSRKKKILWLILRCDCFFWVKPVTVKPLDSRGNLQKKFSVSTLKIGGVACSWFALRVKMLACYFNLNWGQAISLKGKRLTVWNKQVWI